MEIETKIENPATRKRIDDLESDDQKIVEEAVNYLARQDRNKQLKAALREIVENFRSCESLAAIWAIVILGIMRDKEAAPYLLDVFESDEDFAKEAADDALVLIERAYRDSVVPSAMEFIARRVANDPHRARIYAIGFLGEFIDRESVRIFLVKLFEEDKDMQDFIGSILVNAKDTRMLELFKRSLAFAEQSGAVDFEVNEMKWHYYYLASGISYAEKYPENQLWKEHWEKRWGHLLKKLGKDDEDDDGEFNEEKLKQELEKFKQDLEKRGMDEEFKKELAARDAQIIEPFCLAIWLEIRQRSEIESEFQRTLDLIGAGEIWQVEDIQKIMNESRSSGPIIKMISERVNIPDEKSLTAVIENLNQLWNNTPREELHGLTPAEKMGAYLLAQE